jgi:hypothetical protein
MIPLPLGRGEHPTITPVFGSRVNRRSVGPSAQSNADELLPIGFVERNACELFSSDAVAAVVTVPVPSSNSVTENVLDAPANPAAVQASSPDSGTLIHLTLNAFTLANPNACTGNVPQFTALADGFKSVHAGAILAGPDLNVGTVGLLDVEPTPNVMFPFEFQKNPFHVHAAVPTGPPNTNSNPPDNTPVNGGLPAPSLSSPRFGGF